ncbi:MAG: hypothetical protein CGW95_13460 [Phenylobacterium zucineum]|nr:MAG: hypothetical protein CGW95_13460 [Phenylobacterium zucineum]
MTQTNPQFLFVAAPQVRGGPDHLLRSLILAQALADCGGGCTIISTPQLESRLSDLAPTLTRATALSDSAADISLVAGRLTYDAIVIDHPGLGLEDHLALAGDRPSIVMDDLADRQIGGRIIVNPSLTIAPTNYLGLVPESAEILTGPLYAPMISEIARRRGESPAERGEVHRVLLSIPADEPADFAMRLIDGLRPRLGETVMEVLVPQDFENLRSLNRIASRDPRLVLHKHPHDRPTIVSRADLAIIPIGPDIWEACALGLPIIALAASPADMIIGAHLAQIEAAIVLETSDRDFEGHLDRALVRLLTSPPLRRKLSAHAASLTDGSGAGRIAHKLIGLLSR